MKRAFYLTTIIILLSPHLLADSLKTMPTEIKYQIIVDTLKMQNIGGSKKVFDGTNMPWIVALIIGLLTVAINIYIARRNRETLEKQVNASREIAVKQIENTKALALIEFNKTLKSKNRQDWITDVRQSISELISYTKLLNIEFNIAESKDAAKRTELMQKISYSKSKLELLLNPENDNKSLHKTLDEAVALLFNILDEQFNNNGAQTELNVKFIEQSEQVIIAGRKVLYDEWNKIQEAKDSMI